MTGWWRDTSPASPATLSALQGLLLMVLAALAGTALLGLLGRPGPAATPAPATQPLAAEPLTVHVAGQVLHPGLYRLAAGSRVNDAINAAGGPAAEARLDAINLARILQDGEQLYVPGPHDQQPHGGKLSLNRASAAQLEALPGIGPVLAQRIVDHRSAHGPFTRIDELRRVEGIGAALFRRLEALVTV